MNYISEDLLPVTVTSRFQSAQHTIFANQFVCGHKNLEEVLFGKRLTSGADNLKSSNATVIFSLYSEQKGRTSLRMSCYFRLFASNYSNDSR